MKCECQSLDDTFYLERGPKGFEGKLKKVDTGNWIHLYECPKCGQFWSIDEWDKYGWQVVSRVLERDGWDSLDREKERKALLLNERGGTTDEVCMRADCTGKRVKGIVYCIDHLWQTGATK